VLNVSWEKVGWMSDTVRSLQEQRRECRWVILK
jgi:hypothetical protein